MYYSTMANCLNYAAYIPKHYCSLVGVSIRQNKLACRTPPGDELGTHHVHASPHSIPFMGFFVYAKQDIMASFPSPEYSTILERHIADINQRIAEADLSLYADELLQAGLITQSGHSSAIAITGRAPRDKIASLTAEAMGKIKTSPHLFDALVDILEKRDQDFASILRRERSECQCKLAMLLLLLFLVYD